jgi:trans-aconitate 2-methyltransferase
VRESPLLAPEAYARLLFRLGFARQRVRLEVYAHPLPTRDDVAEWVRGTTLTDYEKRLDAPTWAAFLARYRERLRAALPDERPFVYTFRRLFLWGRRP